jgi:hypothetical protein
MPRRQLHRAVLAALALTMALLGSGMAQEKTVTVEIARMQLGLEPENFTLWRTGQGDPAEWRVVADPSAADGKAIAQTSKDKTDYRLPLAVYRPISAKNVEVTLRFKPVGGSVDQAGGIAVRLSTADDYYVVRANALEDNVRFYRVISGRREQIKGVDIKVASGQWHTLGLRAEGDKFTVSFDGKAMFTAEDKTFAGAGKVALWTKADSITHFDNIIIAPLP